MLKQAADAINYAQSTVSAQIMALDEDLGIAPDQIPQLTEKLFEDQGQSLAGLIAKHQKPLVGFSFHSHEVLSIQKLRHHGIPVFPSLDRTARTMAALVDYSLLVDKIKSNT